MSDSENASGKVVKSQLSVMIRFTPPVQSTTKYRRLQCVSIRALARRATKWLQSLRSIVIVSIRALARRAPANLHESRCRLHLHNRQIKQYHADSLRKKAYDSAVQRQKSAFLLRRPLRVSAHDWGMRRLRQTASIHFRPAVCSMKSHQRDSP